MFCRSSSGNKPSDTGDPVEEGGDPGVGIRLSGLTPIVGTIAGHSNLDVLCARAKVPFTIFLPVERATTVATADAGTLVRCDANVLWGNLRTSMFA